LNQDTFEELLEIFKKEVASGTS